MRGRELFYQAPIIHLQEEADELFALKLFAQEPRLRESHLRPGQYTYLHLPDLPHLPTAPFALASAPGAEAWEFLVKLGSPLAYQLTRCRIGDRVEVSPALGPGFPLEHAKGRRVLLFATGSGISPIRSTLLAIRQERAAFGEVTLYFGARTPAGFAYLDEHPEWEADGIRIIRTVSQPGQSGWTGLTGYVQSHLLGVGHREDAVFLCGQDSMVAEVKAALLSQGVRPENLFLNV